MTTILKQMGIQQWRLRSAAPETVSAVVSPSSVAQNAKPLNDADVQANGMAISSVAAEMAYEPSSTQQLDKPVEVSATGSTPSAALAALSRPKQKQAASSNPTESISVTTASAAATPSPMPAAMPKPMPVARQGEGARQAPLTDQATISSDPLGLLDWQGLQSVIDGQTQCHSCGAANASLGSGDANANWLFVSDAPNGVDLQSQQLFSGRAGQLYEAMLLAVGLDRASVYTTSVFKCAASDDLSVVPTCDKLLHRQIELVQPRVIVTFGEFATQSVARSNESLEQLRSQDLMCHRSKVPIVASYSLLQLLDQPPLKAGAWQDLKKCIAITR